MADVNVTEKVAREEAQRRWPSYPAVGFSGAEDRQAAFIAGALWHLDHLAGIEVLAGIAGVLRQHAIDGRKTWGWVYCACGWVAKEKTTADGYREHREHVAAAVVEWLRGQAL